MFIACNRPVSIVTGLSYIHGIVHTEQKTRIIDHNTIQIHIMLPPHWEKKQKLKVVACAHAGSYQCDDVVCSGVDEHYIYFQYFPNICCLCKLCGEPSDRIGTYRPKCHIGTSLPKRTLNEGSS